MVQTERFCPHCGFRRRLYLAWKLYPAICSQRVCTDWGGGRRTYMCKHVQQQRWHEADCSGLWHFFGSTHVEEFGSGKEMVTGWFYFFFSFFTDRSNIPQVFLFVFWSGCNVRAAYFLFCIHCILVAGVHMVGAWQVHLPLSCRAVDTEQRFVSTKHLPLGLKPCETQLNPSVVSKVSHSLRFSQKSPFYVDVGSAAAELMEMHMQACVLLKCYY